MVFTRRLSRVAHYSAFGVASASGGWWAGYYASMVLSQVCFKLLDSMVSAVEGIISRVLMLMTAVWPIQRHGKIHMNTAPRTLSHQRQSTKMEPRPRLQTSTLSCGQSQFSGLAAICRYSHLAVLRFLRGYRRQPPNRSHPLHQPLVKLPVAPQAPTKPAAAAEADLAQAHNRELESVLV